MIEQSICGGWTGLFELKEQDGNGKPGNLLSWAEKEAQTKEALSKKKVKEAMEYAERR